MAAPDIHRIAEHYAAILQEIGADLSLEGLRADDSTGLPSLKQPVSGPFLVQGIYTDFKRHDLGPNFHERTFDGTVQTQFMTTPLWGVGSTAPYGHDCRSINLTEVILRHGGEAYASAQTFDRLQGDQRAALLELLESLVCSRPTTLPQISPRGIAPIPISHSPATAASS